MSNRIVVVEDDFVMASMLKLHLEREGYQVTVEHDGVSGLKAAQSDGVDLIILDLMLPKIDGWEICRIVRRGSQVPIILLTAMDDEHDKVRGLDLGADDYITKPFSILELLARVRTCLRRHQPRTSPGIVLPGLVVDPVGRTVDVNGKPVELSPKEFDLLLLFVRDPDRVFTHETLVDRIWKGTPETDDHTLRTHVVRLRRKLGEYGDKHVRTVWGIGYKFQVNVQ